MKDRLRQRIEQAREDRFARTLAKGEVEEETSTSLLKPSPNPATNMLIADIVLRGVSSLFRERVQRQVARSSYSDDDKARELLDGRTLLTTLGLYGVSKIATRSPVGLGVVTGGLVLKTLYDRGKRRQRRRRATKSSLPAKSE